MKYFRGLLLLVASMPMAVHAHDFPTSGRVEYVLECMSNHAGKQEYLYKCSCTIDQIAQEIAYSDYVEMAAALRYQTLGGPGGAEFRDPGAVKTMANTYKALQAKARTTCFVQ